MTQHPPIKPTWWNRNKGYILGSIAVTTVALVVMQRAGLKSHNQFLVAKGLDKEYYNPED
jgi:hypothetical protein